MRDLGIMDYSLLIGIEKYPTEVPRTPGGIHGMVHSKSNTNFTINEDNNRETGANN